MSSLNRQVRDYKFRKSRRNKLYHNRQRAATTLELDALLVHPPVRLFQDFFPASDIESMREMLQKSPKEMVPGILYNNMYSRRT